MMEPVLVPLTRAAIHMYNIHTRIPVFVQMFQVDLCCHTCPAVVLLSETQTAVAFGLFLVCVLNPHSSHLVASRAMSSCGSVWL